MKRINVNLLIDKCHEIFMKAGIPEADAALLTDVLVTTDMRGVNSHGVMRSASYLDCINAGGIRAIAEPQVLSETPASFQVSAAGGLGIPAACKTMRRVIEKCSEQAVVCATVNHSDHYGAAGYYAMMGAEAGLLTFSMSNTCPLVAPTGGRAATIGNNPFAYAAPGERHHAVLFDVCMSKVATGKIAIMAKDGKPIPPDWMLDRNGAPTTDANEVYHGGVMLPFAEHKGYGFAVMVELLTGVLAMSGMMDEVKSWNGALLHRDKSRIFRRHRAVQEPRRRDDRPPEGVSACAWRPGSPVSRRTGGTSHHGCPRQRRATAGSLVR